MQVDVALECARLQHRLTLPPLEVEDFPQVGLTNYYKVMPTTPICETPNGTDIVHEILSVACASQQLINPTPHQNAWEGGFSNADDDFTFMTAKDIYQSQVSCSQYMNIEPLEESITRSIEISDHHAQLGDLKMERMAENLRWVGMSSKDLEQVTNLQKHVNSYLISMYNFNVVLIYSFSFDWTTELFY